MVDTVRTLSALQTLLADNTSGAISAQDVRDFLVSAWTPGWTRYFDHRLPTETGTADDDFFNDADHSAYTKVAITGTGTWAENLGRLSVIVDDQSSLDTAGAVKALTASGPPLTVESAILMRSLATQTTSTVGVGFTDGTAASSNIAFANFTANATAVSLRARAGTLTTFNGDVNTSVDGLDETFFSPHVFLRCVWTAANTFDISFSFDGVSWSSFGLSAFAKTMTPTNLILVASTSGGASPLNATFEYVRVTEADLS